MVVLGDTHDYNLEGFAQLDTNNIVLNDKNQLQYDHIEDYEIVETNKEYAYYSKHFFDRVKEFLIINVDFVYNSFDNLLGIKGAF